MNIHTLVEVEFSREVEVCHESPPGVGSLRVQHGYGGRVSLIRRTDTVLSRAIILYSLANKAVKGRGLFRYLRCQPEPSYP